MSRRRGRSQGGPPEGEPWVWLTQELVQSPAWQGMPLCARRALDRIIVEHMAHAGRENGGLIVTYDDFVSGGVGSRSGTARAIRILEALGFIEVTVTGRRIDGYRWVPARISGGIPHPLTGSARASALASWRALRGCTGLRP